MNLQPLAEKMAAMNRRQAKHTPNAFIPKRAEKKFVAKTGNIFCRGVSCERDDSGMTAR
jgi:hypothetical protein